MMVHHGILMRRASKIIASAREEIEYSKHEKDPYVIAQLLMNGRKALQDLSIKINDLEAKMQEQFAKTTFDELQKKKNAPYIIPDYLKQQAQFNEAGKKKRPKIILQ